MSGAAHQPICKLDTLFLAAATVVLIFFWMAQPRGHDAVATPAGAEILQLSSSLPVDPRH